MSAPGPKQCSIHVRFVITTGRRSCNHRGNHGSRDLPNNPSTYGEFDDRDNGCCGDGLDQFSRHREPEIVSVSGDYRERGAAGGHADTPPSEAHGAHPNSCDCRHVLRVTCEGSSTYSLRSVQRTHSPVVSARGPSKGMQGSGQRRVMVGAGRFELPTPCSRSKCATRLRYAPPDRQSFEGQRRSIRSRLAAARAAL